MYHDAYKKANLATENPAQTEYRLFAEITRELEIINKEKSTSPARINTLFRNSQLWLTIRNDLMSEENKLEKETKAGLISLAIWVDKFTSPAMRNPVDLEPLISINIQIMQGLKSAVQTERTSRQASTNRQEQFTHVSI